ncbi:MAG TPA: HAMP domain-containing sensor histidine kinase [Solirubrobacterales bacterium]
MSSGSVRARVTYAGLAVLALALVAVVVGTALAYRARLNDDLQGKVADAASGFERAWPGPAARQLIGTLALEGIATQVDSATGSPPSSPPKHGGPTPIKPGTTITTRGSLVVDEEVLADGTLVRFTASRAQVGEAVWRLVIIEGLVAAAVLTLAALALRRATARALRPLDEIAATAQRIAAGSTAERLHPDRTDTELGHLAAAFDQMVEELERAASRARDSEDAMRRFLTDASHELRTPAAALQASAETLLREQPARPDRDRIEAALARGSARLGRLVDDLLNLARLEGATAPPDGVVHLDTLARSVAATALDGADNIVLSVALRDAGPVRGDRDQLARALDNLLVNSRQALGDGGGHIDLCSGRERQEAFLRVRDDGPGVPDGEHDRIFERFVRLQPLRGPGTGLGLAIARQTARQYGGELTCDPVPAGATFTLRLPLCEVAAVETADPTGRLDALADEVAVTGSARRGRKT